MSDAVAKSLLSTCKYTLKSLSEVLTTLDSIGAFSRLKQDGEAMEALKVVSAFTQSLLPLPARSTTADGLLSGSKTAAVEERNRLERIPGRRNSTSQDVETHTLEDRRVQDGRDEAIYEIPAVQGSTPDDNDLLGPPPSFPAPKQRFYSVLVYFPAFFLSRETVTVKEKQMLLAVIHSASGNKISNAASRLTTTSYPRIRLIPARPPNFTDYYICPTAALILDDDAERLRRIQEELHSVQYQRWSNLDESCIRRDLFFVRAWGESPVVLVFRFKTWDQLSEAPSPQTQRTVIAALFQRHPILAHYQYDSSSAGPRIAVGKAALYRGDLYAPYKSLSNWTRPWGTCILMPLFNVDQRYPDAAMDFALDFAAEHSGGEDVPLEGIASEIGVDRMRDPELWSSPGGAAWAAADSR